MGSEQSAEAGGIKSQGPHPLESRPQQRGGLLEAARMPAASKRGAPICRQAGRKGQPPARMHSVLA